MPIGIEERADSLVQKIKHYLITRWGHLEDEISEEEFYEALSFALREEIMINWSSALHTFHDNNVRTLYYLSMEYLPGRILSNNITNLKTTELIKLVSQKMHRNFSHVMRLEREPGLGNGGLGRLASCFLDSLATLKYPSMGYGLRYQYGTFEQDIINGLQIERPDRWLIRPNPWEYRRDFRSYRVYFSGDLEAIKNKKNETSYNLKGAEQVRAIAFDIPIVGYDDKDLFSVVTLRLWSTRESPRNFQLQRFNAGQLDQAAENMTLTDVLYPNDNHEMGKRIRLKQEFLLVSASIQDIIKRHLMRGNSIEKLPEKVAIQINDTHPAVVIAELMHILIHDFDFSFKQAFKTTQGCMSFTNHTIMKEALEEWNEIRFNNLLPRQYKIIQKLNQQFCDEIRTRFPDNEEKLRRMSFIEQGQIKMAHLAIYGSRYVNGVAQLHSNLLKEIVFRDFYDMYPERFLNVTNGVTQRRWLKHCNPRLSDWITERIGNKWLTDFTELSKLHDYAQDSESIESFLQIKKYNKAQVNYFIECMNAITQKDNRKTHYPLLDTDSLFDVHIKRIHEYKRQLMKALHTIIVYQEIKQNPQARKIKRSVIFGGKAAPGYKIAKDLVLLISILARKINHDPDVSPYLKVFFVENYNVSKAETLIPAADLSEQISTAGMEASGTGNMKLAINGALTIGTQDGANIEMREQVTDQWWPFTFGATSQEIDLLRISGSYKPWEVLEKHPHICRAVNALQDQSLTDDPAESQILKELFTYLMEGFPPDIPADRFFVLHDLPAYYETQKKVEDLYSEPQKWGEYAIHNMASMGMFSSDIAIQTYASQIWNLKPKVIDSNILKKVRCQYETYDTCRIHINPNNNYKKTTTTQTLSWKDRLKNFFNDKT